MVAWWAEQKVDLLVWLMVVRKVVPMADEKGEMKVDH